MQAARSVFATQLKVTNDLTVLSAIPLPPTIQGLGDLTDANDGQHGLVDGEAGIASQGQGQSQEQHSDRQTDSSNANVAPREHLYDQDHTHTEHDPEKKTIISPVQPHRRSFSILNQIR